MSYVSFVIPAYNCAKTLEEAVDSIFAGNYEAGDEVIIVNDASTDGTVRVLERMQQRRPEIQVITNAVNRGCPASRNVGIRAAHNELIFNLDSDNVLAPQSIGPLKKCMGATDAGVAAFGVTRFFKTKKQKTSRIWTFPNKELLLQDILTSHITPAPQGNFLYKKSVWEKVGGYTELGKGLHEAWGFSLKLLANGIKFVILPNFYYYHRHGGSSLFTRESKKPLESGRVASQLIAPFLNKIEDEDVRYIAQNPAWFDSLNDRPIKIKNTPLGTVGLKVTVPQSFLGRCIERIKRILRA